MTIYRSIPAENGVYVIDVGSLLGQVEVRIVARSAPAAGALRVQGVTAAGGTLQFAGAAALALSGLAGGALTATEFGFFRRIVLTLSDVAGASDPLEIVVSRIDAAGPPDAYLGNRALIVQSYVEANAKLGTQFFLRTSATVAAGATWSLGFQTAALPVLIKSRDCYALAEAITLAVFKGAVYAGGTPIDVQNFNDIAPVGSTITATSGVTPSVNGTQWGGSEHLYGSNSVAQRTGAGLPVGGERVLSPNKAYMVSITNGGSGVVELDYFLTWFEGTPDLPRS